MVAETETRVRAVRPPFARYLDAHADAVLGYLRSMLAADDADDVFQEAFIAALRAWGPGSEEPGRAWIFRIAHNKAIDHHRAAARRALTLADPPERASSDPDRLEAVDLRRRVAGLAAGQRDAVGLRFFADLSHREIGDALGCSEAAARRRVADGLAALRDQISEEDL